MSDQRYENFKQTNKNSHKFVPVDADATSVDDDDDENEGGG